MKKQRCASCAHNMALQGPMLIGNQNDTYAKNLLMWNSNDCWLLMPGTFSYNNSNKHHAYSRSDIWMRARVSEYDSKPLLFAVFSHSILSIQLVCLLLLLLPLFFHTLICVCFLFVVNINKMVKQKMRSRIEKGKNEMADIYWNSSVFWCFF